MSLKTKIHELRKEIGTMTRTKENPFYKSSYFDINDLIEHLDPILEKHNLMILQPLTVVGNRTGVKTIIFDLESDEINESEALLPDNLDSQKMGGAITFLRRYSIKSLLFIREEDDDANKAVGNSQLPKTLPKSPQASPKLSDEPTVEEVDAYFNSEPFPSKPASTAYPEKVVGAKCPDCPEGLFVRNPKTGKIFCDKKCFATR